MQLMPATAATLLTVDNMERALVDPATNVRLGSRHLRRLLTSTRAGWIWRWRLQRGRGRGQQNDGVPPYAETQQYVRR